MGDVSLYQWLVLGLLFIIALCAPLIAYELAGLDLMLKRSLRAIANLMEALRFLGWPS